MVVRVVRMISGFVKWYCCSIGYYIGSSMMVMMIEMLMLGLKVQWIVDVVVVIVVMIEVVVYLLVLVIVVFVLVEVVVEYGYLCIEEVVDGYCYVFVI